MKHKGVLVLPLVGRLMYCRSVPPSAFCQASLTISQYPTVPLEVAWDGERQVPPLSILSSFLDNLPVPNYTLGGGLGGERQVPSPPPPPLSILSSFLDNSSVPNYTLGGRLGGRTSRVKPLAREHSSVTWPGLEPWALSKARYPEGPKEIQSRTNLCHSYPKTCPQLLCQSQSLLGREIDHRKTFPRHLCCLAPGADWVEAYHNKRKKILKHQPWKIISGCQIDKIKNRKVDKRARVWLIIGNEAKSFGIEQTYILFTYPGNLPLPPPPPPPDPTYTLRPVILQQRT